MTQGIMHHCTNPECGEYTLKDLCPRCGQAAKDPRPARFSPEDHYGKYRRQLKKMDLTKPAPPQP